MSRKYSELTARQLTTPYGDNALTWFFVGILVIAAVAGILGNVGLG